MQRPPFLRFLGDRALDLLGLDTSVRRVIATTYGVLVGLAIATGLRAYFMTGGAYIAQPGIPLPKSIVWIAACGTLIAVTFLLSGFAHAKSWWRYVALVPVLLASALWYYAAPFGLMNGHIEDRSWLIWPVVGFATAAAAIVIFGPRVRTRYLLAAIGGLLLVAAVFAIVFTALYWPSYGPTILLLSTGLGAYLLLPALLVVGWDLSEIAVDGANAMGSLVRRQPEWAKRAFRIAMILVVVVAAAILHNAVGIRRFDWYMTIAAWTLVLTIGLVTQLILAGRAPAHGAHAHLRYQHVFYVACALIVTLMAGPWFEVPDNSYFNYSAGHEFSMTVPPGFKEDMAARWFRFPPGFNEAERNTIEDHFDMRVGFLTNTKPFHNIFIVAIEHQPYRIAQDEPKTLNDMVSGSSLSPMRADFQNIPNTSWQKAIVDAKNKKGGVIRFLFYKNAVYGQLPTTDADWYVICGGARADFAKTRAYCNQTAHTFHSSHLATLPSYTAAIAFDLSLFAAAIIALIFIAVKRTRSPSPIAKFCFWAFSLATLYCLGDFVLGLSYGDSDFPVGTCTDLYVAALLASAIRALIFELVPGNTLWGVDKHALRAISARVNVTLVLLGTVLYVYDIVVSFSEQSQGIRGLVICLALTWELMTAGRTINESPSGSFPRVSQILIFVGYLVFVATAVFMFGGLDMAYTGFHVKAIDTEEYVSLGIVLLGVAYVVSREPRALAHLRHVQEPADAAAPLPEGGAA